jgi:dTDP-4-dehydrorhamnose 3,5-epimerase
MTSFEPMSIPDVMLITPVQHRDNRGVFSEVYVDQITMPRWSQENQSTSYKTGTVRGLHFQRGVYAQTKLVRCAWGSILDVAVDIRPESPTYGQHVSAVLTSDDGTQLLVPKGFAHGFMTLTDNTVVVYKVDNVYNKESEGSLLWNDPDLDIAWYYNEATEISEKDALAPPLRKMHWHHY